MIAFASFIQTRHHRFARALGVSVTSLLALAACTPESAQVASTRPAPPQLPSPQVMLAQVRYIGADPSSRALDVVPLRDPAIADLQDRATALEAHGDFTGAEKSIAHALTIRPGDPELLQQAAEYALYRHDWNDAGTLAHQSYDRGPKVGSLCRRNWATLRFVALAHSDLATARHAHDAVLACNVEPPPRY
ncbi:MAG: tetratricopeptide repeat protein [Proteobacteria bacterium]|nr:tetratricopeptide repeat protein [Pseudomonadota bacterium]